MHIYSVNVKRLKRNSNKERHSKKLLQREEERGRDIILSVDFSFSAAEFSNTVSVTQGHSHHKYV